MSQSNDPTPLAVTAIIAQAQQRVARFEPEMKRARRVVARLRASPPSTLDEYACTAQFYHRLFRVTREQRDQCLGALEAIVELYAQEADERLKDIRDMLHAAQYARETAERCLDRLNERLVAPPEGEQLRKAS